MFFHLEDSFTQVPHLILIIVQKERLGEMLHPRLRILKELNELT
jgi:hypothetical protein